MLNRQTAVLGLPMIYPCPSRRWPGFVALMNREDINQLPVIFDGHPEGVFFLGNFVRFFEITPSSTTKIRAKAALQWNYC